MRKNLEHEAQVAVFKWAAMARGEFPDLSRMFAIPNGGARNPITAKNLKAEGVRAGVLDICLPVARFGADGQLQHHGLFIEMKIKPNTVSELQAAEIVALQSYGYKAVVCWSSHEAIAELQKYLSRA